MNSGIETERKFIVQIPDFSAWEARQGYTVSRIEQTYLESEPSITHRVRKRAYADRTEYYETKKTRLTSLSAIEEERAICEAEYATLLGRQACGTRTLIKVRHTVPENGFLYEFDVYPEWHKTCIMEVELPSETTPLPFPTSVRVVEEVTGIRAYSNASMSRSFPKEKEI